MENQKYQFGVADEQSLSASVSSFSLTSLSKEESEDVMEIVTEDISMNTSSQQQRLVSAHSSILKKNSKTKVSKRLLMEKLHVNNISKKPYKVVIPRIVKSDIRRQYPTMLINLLNMSELEMISTFFLSFCHRNTVLESVVLPPPQSNPRYQQSLQPLTPQMFRLTSFVEMSKFLWMLTLAVPDLYVKLKAASISTKSDSFRTEIILEVSVYGTKIYNANPVEIATMVRQMELEGRDCNGIGPKEIATRMIQSGKYCTPTPLRVEGRYVITIYDYRESLKIDKIYQQSIALMD